MVNGLFFSGDNTKQQLSFTSGIKQSEVKPMIVDSRELLDPTDSIRSIALGEYHTIVLSESGQVYVLGQNSSGQLGLLGPKTQSITKLNFPNSSKISKISAKRFHSAFLTFDSDLYMCGADVLHHLGIDYTTSAFVPTKLPGQKVATMELGFYHFLFTNTMGEIFGGGRNNELQCGTGEDTGDYGYQQILHLPPGIVKYSCGGFHSAFLDLAGQVWMCGSNYDGQQGLLDAHHVNLTPTLLEIEHPATDIACGNSHTAILTNNGQVYVMGYNKYFQIGLEIPGSVRIPTLLPADLFEGEKVTHISCGVHGTLFCTENQALFGSGFCKYNQLLAHNDNPSEGCTVTKVNDSNWESLKSKVRVVLMQSGFKHSVVLFDYNMEDIFKDLLFRSSQNLTDIEILSEN